MSNTSTVYTDRATAVRMARDRGKSTEEIVRAVAANLTYKQVRGVAEEWAPELGISVAAFVKIAWYR